MMKRPSFYRTARWLMWAYVAVALGALLWDLATGQRYPNGISVDVMMYLGYACFGGFLAYLARTSSPVQTPPPEESP